MDKSGICLSSALWGAPTEIQVIPPGRHRTAKGDFLLDTEAAAHVMAAFEASKNLMPIDYEHQGLRGGMAPAAGWISSLMYRGDEGLWAEVEWTPRARGLLEGCEYRYLSPVFVKSEKDDRVVRLMGAALTNTPAIDGMVPVTGGRKKGITVPPPDEEARNRAGRDRVPGPSFKERKEEFMKKVLDALGLEETEGREGAMAAIGVMRRELQELGESLKRVAKALGLGPGANGRDMEGTAMAMRQEAEEAGALRRRLRENEAGDLVEMAMKEGKVSPAQKDWAMEYALRDAGSFRVFVAKAPVVVPVAELSLRSDISRKGTACPVQAEVNRALGLSHERFMRFSRKEDK
jgi:phage I-like protein